jgi:hypothetical protein
LLVQEAVLVAVAVVATQIQVRHQEGLELLVKDLLVVVAIKIMVLLQEELAVAVVVLVPLVQMEHQVM